MKKGVATILLLAWLSAAAGGEHPACRDIDHPFRQHSPEELRIIGQSCADPSMGTLMSHRARNAELAADHAFFERIEQVNRSRADWHMDINEIFLGLVEAFSGELDLTAEQRISVLDSAYARANEIAELRLRGYDPQAARLESWGPSTLLMRSTP